MLRMMLVAIVALGAFLFLEAKADAAPSVQYGIQDDAWLLGGPGTLDERLDQVDGLGVDVVRVNLRWNEIAAKRPVKPTSHLDLAYDWTVADVLLRGGCAREVSRRSSPWSAPRAGQTEAAPRTGPRRARARSRTSPTRRPPATHTCGVG